MLAPNTLNNAFVFYCSNLKHTEIWDYIGECMRELRNSEEKIIFFSGLFYKIFTQFSPTLVQWIENSAIIWSSLSFFIMFNWAKESFANLELRFPANKNFFKKCVVVFNSQTFSQKWIFAFFSTQGM